MSKAFTLIEVMVTLTMLVLMIVLGYSLFGSAAKNAKVSSLASAIKRDLDVIEHTYHEYYASTGQAPGTFSDFWTTMNATNALKRTLGGHLNVLRQMCVRSLTSDMQRRWAQRFLSRQPQ